MSFSSFMGNKLNIASKRLKTLSTQKADFVLLPIKHSILQLNLLKLSMTVVHSLQPFARVLFCHLRMVT